MSIKLQDAVPGETDPEDVLIETNRAPFHNEYIARLYEIAGKAFLYTINALVPAYSPLLETAIKYSLSDRKAGHLALAIGAIRVREDGLGLLQLPVPKEEIMDSCVGLYHFRKRAPMELRANFLLLHAAESGKKKLTQTKRLLEKELITASECYKLFSDEASRTYEMLASATLGMLFVKTNDAERYLSAPDNVVAPAPQVAPDRVSIARTAEMFGVSERTVSSWDKKLKEGKVSSPIAGYPGRHSLVALQRFLDSYRLHKAGRTTARQIDRPVTGGGVADDALANGRAPYKFD
jgi:hypothetical protein